VLKLDDEGYETNWRVIRPLEPEGDRLVLGLGVGGPERSVLALDLQVRPITGVPGRVLVGAQHDTVDVLKLAG